MWGPDGVEACEEDCTYECIYEDQGWSFTHAPCNSKIKYMNTEKRQALRNNLMSFKGANGYRIGQKIPTSPEGKILDDYIVSAQFDLGCRYCLDTRCIRLVKNNIYFGNERVHMTGGVMFEDIPREEKNYDRDTYYIWGANVKNYYFSDR